jgi:hypothetical protein
MYSEVLNKEKKSLRVYWYAAAGLFLVIGFSVFFLINNPWLDKKEVALNVLKQEEAPPPVDIPLPAQDEQPNKLKSAEKKEVSETISQKGDLVSTGKATGSGGVVAADSRLDDNLALAKKNADMEAPAEVAVGNTEENANENYKTKLEEEKIVDKDYKDQNDVVLSTNRASLDKMDEPKKESKDDDSFRSGGKNKRKKAESQKAPKTEETPGSIAFKKSTREESKAEDRSENDIKQAETKSSSAAAPSYGNGPVNTSPAPVSFYAGGESALLKDVKEKLTAMKIDKKFNATLFINSKNEVQDVRFTKTFDLNKDDETHIVEALKTLNKFNLTSTKSGPLFEYKLQYRP